MNIKKLALASAIATLPMGAAFALDEINDEAMSEVSGQDGISLTLGIGAAGITTDIYLHDKDGLGAAVAYSFDGAIVIDDMQIGVGGANISIGIDAGASALTAGNPVLNISIGLPAALTIATGAIKVANSQRDATAPGSSWSVDTISSNILNTMTIILGGTTLNIQLGNEVQTGSIGGTDMIVLSSTITGGLSISGFRLSDATGTGDGGIGATTISVVDASGSGNLTLAIDGNVTDAGLVLGLGTLGSGGMEIRIVDQFLGTSTNAKLGDVSIVGLNLNGSTLTINGKN